MSDYKTTAECWQEYPKLKFPDNIARGAAQKRARDACVAASMRGEPDPKLAKGPAILDDAAALWAAKPPYKKRPIDKAGNTAKVVGRIATLGTSSLKGVGDSLRSMATGWRPPTGLGNAKLQGIEMKGTILGGLDTLIAAGIEPWVSLEPRVARLPQENAKGDAGLDMPLLGVVQDAAKMQGDRPPKDLEAATEYMRRKVRNKGLGAAAWHARTVRIATIAIAAQKKTKAVSSGISAGVTAAGLGLHAAAAPVDATGVGLIVGIPMHIVGGILNGIGGVASAANAGATIGAERNEALINKSISAFQHELEMRNIKVQTRQIRKQIQQAQADESNTLLGFEEGEQLAKVIQAGVWVAVISATGLGFYWIAKRRRRA